MGVILALEGRGGYGTCYEAGKPLATNLTNFHEGVVGARRPRQRPGAACVAERRQARQCFLFAFISALNSFKLIRLTFRISRFAIASKAELAVRGDWVPLTQIVNRVT